MTESTAPEIDFEATLKELEELVRRMESGELGLEESLKAFERGVKLNPPVSGCPEERRTQGTGAHPKTTNSKTWMRSIWGEP